ALRLPEGAPPAAHVLGRLAEEAARLVADGVLVSATLFLRDDALTDRRTVEHDLRTETLATPAGALVGEAAGEDPAAVAATRLDRAFGTGEGTPARTRIYRVQSRRRPA
ncbi:hypothetical protein, partial [Salinarimonas chemoclinalis]|uniref:hypothetical protein n=1 Tax=Salinarimonas chemoclinalis TaxID=3241599 RepID=UPI003558C0D1